MKRIISLYFSPNGTVKRSIEGVISGLKSRVDSDVRFLEIDLTLKENREKEIEFNMDDVVIVGMPVYAGRVPNILLKSLRKIKGRDARAFAHVVYGNRNYDDALIELIDILVEDDFKVLGACASLGQHSFSKKLATNRPDSKDLEELRALGEKLFNSLNKDYEFDIGIIPGNRPYGPYYQPRDKDGNIVNFKDIKPETSNTCIDCKICYYSCPMDSINYEDVSRIGTCIKCCACVNKCPTGAKEFKDNDFVHHKVELELEYTAYKELEAFL